MPEAKKRVAPSLRDKHRAVRKATPSLRNLKNVIFVSFGRKRVAGMRTPEHALIVYVSKKENIRGRNRIPGHVDVFDAQGKVMAELPTDVIELQQHPQLFGVRSGHVLAAGDDEGLCTLSFAKTERNFLLTNAHVACDILDGGTSRAVRLYDRISGEWISVGNAVYATPISTKNANAADFAIVEVPNGVEIDAFKILDTDASISSISGLQSLATERYWLNDNGQILEASDVEYIPGPAPVLMDGTGFLYSNFFQLEMISGEAAPGLSGALLCRTDATGIAACGLVFGGVAPNYLWVFPFNAVWNRVSRTLDIEAM